jgi:hypothetical protein
MYIVRTLYRGDLYTLTHCQLVNIVANLLGKFVLTTRVYRVAMASFWRTFHHDGKISPAWRGRGVHALPL